MHTNPSLLATALCFGCAINLASESEQVNTPEAPVPAIQKCQQPLQGAATVSGRLDSLQLPDGRLLLLSGMATFGNQTSSAGFVVTRDADCPRVESVLAARPIVDVTALGSDLQAIPLTALSSDPAYLYFSTTRTDATPGGIGVAHYDASREQFVALGWLWTSDRPNYGSAAVLQNDTVYVFGGRAARFLSADIYLARVALNRIDQPAAYAYWNGGGNWTSDADLAAPLVEGGVNPTVTWNSTRARWLMAYATPLAQVISARSGLDVDGPWSAPVPLAGCDLPAGDKQAFCDDIVLHPLLAAPDSIVLSQGVGSFERLAGAPLADYATRIAHTPWPGALP